MDEWLPRRLVYFSLEAGSGWWGRGQLTWWHSGIFYLPVNPWAAYVPSAMWMSIFSTPAFLRLIFMNYTLDMNMLAYILIGWMEAQDCTHCSLCFLRTWRWIVVKHGSCKATIQVPNVDSWAESEEKDRCRGQEEWARASNSRRSVSVSPSYSLVQSEKASGYVLYPRDSFWVTQQGRVLLAWFRRKV